LDDKPSLKGRGQGHMTHFKLWHPQSYLRHNWSESPNFVRRRTISSGSFQITDYLLPNSHGQDHVTSFLNFALNHICRAWLTNLFNA